jgi:hypothetical protein
MDFQGSELTFFCASRDFSVSEEWNLMKKRVQRIAMPDRRIYSSLEDASPSHNCYGNMESTSADVSYPQDEGSLRQTKTAVYYNGLRVSALFNED